MIMATVITLQHASLSTPDTVLDIPVHIRPSSEGHEISATLVRVDRGCLRLSSAAPLRPDSTIQLAIEGCTIRAEVVTCEPEPLNRFAVAVRRAYGPEGATRHEPRIPVDISAVVRYPGCDHLFARIIDMSQSGLEFELPTSVGVGTKISVHFEYGIAFGEIRHSGEVAGGWRAGMRIDEFIVRKSAKPKAAVSNWNSARAPRSGFQRLRLAVKRTTCSLLAHEYGWFTDAWERPVLRWSRCEKILT